MSAFSLNLSQRIKNNPQFKSACKDLFSAYVHQMVGNEFSLDASMVRKIATSIQYFYRSNDEDFKKEGAILLSMLLSLQGDHLPELISVADSIFHYSGDFPNLTLLQKKYKKLDIKLSTFEEVNRELRAQINIVESISEPLTDYQRSLWEDLNSDSDVITSAPTSTGKTYLILQYLLSRFSEEDAAFAAIVVPTRALISEVTNKVYQIAKSKSLENTIEICSIPKEGAFKEKTIFVMTQERLFEILQSGDIRFDYLFIDEAHNISDQSRGVLLHLTLQRLLEGSNPQLIISMPSPKYQNAFDSVFDEVDFSKHITAHSPVSKIIMEVSLKGKKIEIKHNGAKGEIAINKGFTGTDNAELIFKLGRNESNIVYMNRTDYCEQTAKKISNLIVEGAERNSLSLAADYVEKFLHEEFSLAACLRKGVAFHYGPLPSVVRTMIEELVRNKDVKYIVCTGTLAEGVNLPAKNLFLIKPAQQTDIGLPSTKLENVKLDNITGRAGRMVEHFAGNIFLVKYEDWPFKDYFEEDDQFADKIPTYFKLLNESFNSVLQAIQGNYDHNQSNQYAIYTVANKLLRDYDNSELNSTLLAKELVLSAPQINALENTLKDAFEELEVDKFTLEGNPSIGFIQQNKLYKILQQEANLIEYTLPHPKSSELFDYLERVCTLLNNVGIFIPNKDLNIRFVCNLAKKWIRGDSLKSIINEQIRFDQDQKQYTSCNSSVRKVIKTINNDVQFRMSSALKCYHSLLVNAISSKNLDLNSVKLHSYIELGGCEERFINLVNLGLSRDTAIEIDKILPEFERIQSIASLQSAFERKLLEGMHEITKKEILRLF